MTLVTTDSDPADCRWVDRICPQCKGSGYEYVWVGDGHDPDWCGHCGGAGRWATPILPAGAIQRIGRAVYAAARMAP